MRGIEYPQTSASSTPTFLPCVASAAARFAVIVDLPTPPLPDPTHTTFDTRARAPSGSAPRPSFCCRPDFSWSERTSKATFTRVTPPSAPTALRTAFSKWLRIGQPGVVSETVTSTVPSARASIDRTILSSTMERRSSGSMTAVRAWRIWSRVGMRSILANGWPCPFEVAALRDSRDALGDLRRDLRAGRDAGLHEVLDARADETGPRAGVAAPRDDVAAQLADVA